MAIWVAAGTTRLDSLLKASIGGTFASLTATYHELDTNDGTNYTVRFQSQHATTPFGLWVNYSGGAPNDTTHEFFIGTDTGATRCALRANGGLANFQANDVNLCDPKAKLPMVPLGSQVEFFKKLPTYLGSYKDSPDRIHAMISADDVEHLDPRIVEAWGDKGYKGVREHDITVRSWKAIGELINRMEAAGL